MEQIKTEPASSHYTTRLKLLHEIDRIILTSRSPSEIAAAVIQHLKQLVPYQRASVTLFDFAAGYATVLATQVADQAQRPPDEHPPLTAFEGLATLQEHRHFVMQDLAASSDLSEVDKQLLADDVQAYVMLPLVSRGELLGSLNLGVQQKELLSDIDLEVVQEVADQVAGGVQQALLFEADQRRLRESEAIVKISRALNETLDLEEVFQLIAESAWQIIPRAERTVIHLLDEEEQVLRPTTVTRSGEVNRSGLMMRPGEGIAGHVVVEGELINVANTQTDDRFLAGGRFQQGSLMVAPIKNRTNITGTITVQSGTPHAFSADDERLLTILGTQAALAIKNATLFTAEQRARHVAETLREANTALTKTLNLDAVLETLLAYVARLIPYDSANVMLREGEDHIVISAMRGYGQFLDDPSVVQGATFQTDWPTIRPVIHEQKSIIIADTDVHDNWDRSIGATYIKSWLGVPLVAGGEVIGLYSLDKADPHFFTEEHRQLAEAFAGQAAIAISNALLYRAERQQFKRLQQSQTQLIQAEKMGALGRLVASIAHEINNPIQAIQGCLTLTMEELEEDEPEQETLDLYLGIVKSELNRVATIVQNMRDFYRPAREGMDLIDVHTVLESVLQLTGKQMQRSQVVSETVWAAQLPKVEANPSHLRQVFLNLVLNAIDAMPEGGTLHVETRVALTNSQLGVEPTAVQITFSDTGEGMSQEVASQLFEPFFTTKEQGSGLGLSISYGIIEAHNGEISVSSQEGQGTTFTLLLPVKQP